MYVDEAQRQFAEAVAEEEGRPELSAETFSMRMRIGLLLITMFGEALMVWFAVQAMTSPMGALDRDPFLAVYLGGIQIGLGFFLMVIYGGLMGNNRLINSDGRILWYVAFTFIGPIALPAYWFMHIWPAPYEPWIDPKEVVERLSLPSRLQLQPAR